jgi:two-component sensor histidine kinase/DNA-binding response OmpR family regulator
MHDDKINILLVDDQPAKLLSYEVILRDLGENLIKAASGREALEHLLKRDIAVVLVDVCMPELDGFELAQMVREHPRFLKTAIIFISAVHLSEVDALRGYEMGAVDYVPVPVIPAVLRAKVRVFAELYRKSRQLEALNRELEGRVAGRTAELEASNARLRQSEQLRSLALAAGQMGSWDWDGACASCTLDEGQYRILAVTPGEVDLGVSSLKSFIHSDDLPRLEAALAAISESQGTVQAEFRIRRPNGEIRWCIGVAAAHRDGSGKLTRLTGVTVDITDRKRAEEHQVLLAREVDHRARNVLAVAQAIVRLTHADTVGAYAEAIEGRVGALARAHTLLSRSRWEGADLATIALEELAPYRSPAAQRVMASGPTTILGPAAAQSLALVLHELATNAVKYGALSVPKGRVALSWQLTPEALTFRWSERGGPSPKPPARRGYGTRVIAGSIEGQLGGKAIFEWQRKGLCCTIVLPRTNTLLAGLPATSSLSANPTDEPARPQPLGGRRVLVVEDEALVAMMMKEMLVELDFEVVGPFGNLGDAAAGLLVDGIAAAVLDVNVGGEPIYPFAARIAERGVPLVFVTGYTREAIDERFAAVPVLQKPIERDAMRRVLSADPSARTAAA